MIRLARAADNGEIAAIWNRETIGTIATTDSEPRTPAGRRCGWPLIRRSIRRWWPPSLRLHQRHDLQRAGDERHAASELDRWLDVATLQLML